jgi:hypothetical protein
MVKFLFDHGFKVGLFLILTALGFSVMHIRYQAATIKTITLQRDQNAAQLSACSKQHKINSEVSNEYQSQITALNRRVRDLKRVQPALCIPVSPCGSDAAPAAGHGNGNGIAAGALYDYAGACEALRQQVIGLQNYIRRSE